MYRASTKIEKSVEKSKFEKLKLLIFMISLRISDFFEDSENLEALLSNEPYFYFAILKSWWFARRIRNVSYISIDINDSELII